MTDPAAKWIDGWWYKARRAPANPGRLGGGITPRAIVLHTTDMPPGSFDGLIKNTTTQIGGRNSQHFVLGRDETQGIVQNAPITVNANHAGASSTGRHGWYVINGQRVHPNTIAVGIETHNAGMVRLVGSQWFWGEGQPWKPYGAPIPSGDVEPDPARPGLGYHKPTPYQLELLGELVDDIKPMLLPLPAGTTLVNTEPPAAWAAINDVTICGHHNLDAEQRSDPWRLIYRWLRARAVSPG